MERKGGAMQKEVRKVGENKVSREKKQVRMAEAVSSQYLAIVVTVRNTSGIRGSRGHTDRRQCNRGHRG